MEQCGLLLSKPPMPAKAERSTFDIFFLLTGGKEERLLRSEEENIKYYPIEVLLKWPQIMIE